MALTPGQIDSMTIAEFEAVAARLRKAADTISEARALLGMQSPVVPNQPRYRGGGNAALTEGGSDLVPGIGPLAGVKPPSLTPLEQAERARLMATAPPMDVEQEKALGLR